MKIVYSLIGSLAFGISLSASAQTLALPTTAPEAPTNVAVISFQSAVGQTNEFQRNFGDMRKKYEPKMMEIKSRGAEIEELEKQLQVQGDKLSDAEQASRARTIEDKKKQAQRLSEDTQNDYDQETQQVFNAVATKVGELLVAYAQQQGYTVVLDVSQQQEQAPMVLYAQPYTDITKTIIDAYNTQSGIPAPPAEPAAVAPRPAVKPSAAH